MKKKILSITNRDADAVIIEEKEDEMETVIECPYCHQRTTVGKTLMVSGFVGCEKCYWGEDGLLETVMKLHEENYPEYVKGDFYKKGCQKWTLTDFLGYFDFSYRLYDDGHNLMIGLIDEQSANFGDIESERFENNDEGVKAIIDRLDTYYQDYIFGGLAETLETEHGIKVSDTDWEAIYVLIKGLNLDYDMDIMPYIFGDKKLILDSDNKKVVKKNKHEEQAKYEKMLKEYHKYQLQWMIDHGYSLRDLFSRMVDISERDDFSGDEPFALLIDEIYDILELETGFDKSEIWATFGEWQENERSEEDE